MARCTNVARRWTEPKFPSFFGFIFDKLGLSTNTPNWLSPAYRSTASSVTEAASSSFTFDGSTKPFMFSMGVVPGSRFRVEEGLPPVDFSSEPTARPFIHSLRPIWETVFNLFDRSASRPGQWKSLPVDGCDKALKFAEEALEKSQDRGAAPGQLDRRRRCNHWNCL